MSYTKGNWHTFDNGSYFEIRSDAPDVDVLPWAAIGDVCASKYSQFGDLGSDNARRIVDCVNACSGMDDPAKEIAELSEQRDALLKELDVLANGYPGNGWDVGLVPRIESAKELIKSIMVK